MADKVYLEHLITLKMIGIFLQAMGLILKKDKERVVEKL